MSTASIEMDAMSRQKFAGLLAEMERDLNKEPKKALMQVGRIAAVHAARLTPMEMRETVMAGIEPTKIGKGWGRPYVMLRPAKPFEMKVRGKAFAKSGWYSALAGTKGRASAVRGVGRRFGSFSMTGSGNIVGMVFSNDVPYIGDLDQGGPYNPPANISTKTMHNTERAMEAILDRAAKKYAAKWSR